MSQLVNRHNQLAQLYERAKENWHNGEFRVAFPLYLKAAKAGWVPAFYMVAQCCDNGWGTKADSNAALYWYKRAYRSEPSWDRRAHRLSLSTSANNIGCILRDKGQRREALRWFKKAVELGDGDANLQIAKIYLDNERSRKAAISYLKKTARAPYATDGSIEEAKTLLKKIRGNEGGAAK